MQKDIMVYVDDIISSMKYIEEYTRGISFDQFRDNSEKQDAVLRRFETIGEAAARLTDEFKRKYKSIPLREMIGLRNIIIHDYSTVDLRKIWTIIKRELTKNRKRLEQVKKEITSKHSRLT